MSEVKKLIKGVQACEKFAKQLELHNVTIKELETLGEIAPSVLENIQFLRDWVTGRLVLTTTEEVLVETDTSTEETPSTAPVETCCAEPWLEIDPNAEWRRLYSTDLMVSDKGTFYDIKKNTLIKPMFIDGELRVVVDDTDQGIKRAAVLVTRAFGLHSIDRNGEYIIGFKDGDRRNLSINNLQWVQEPVRNETLCLVEDICRRIVEFNGDVNKVLGEYEGSKPKVTEKFVKAVINKEIHANISNGFFVMMDGKIYPREKQRDEQNSSGMDTAGFLVMSGDKKMTKSLLKDKIDRGHDLSLTEKTVIVFMAIESIGGKKVPDVTTIARAVSNEFKIDIPFDFIESIRNDYSSEIAKVFGR